MGKVSSYTSAAAVADADLIYVAVEDGGDFLDRNITGLTAKRQFGATGTSTTTDPTTGDDTADGYRAGSLWLNTTDGGLFVCEDASAGAAVWTELAASSGVGDVVGPASATSGNIATFNGTTGKLIQDGGYTIAELAAIPVSINAQTGTTYTLVLADAGKLVTLSNAAAITLTVPTNASVAFPVGTVIAGAQLGAGLVSIAGATGVTINGTTPGAEAASGQYATWTLTKLATDTWLASGGLA